MHKISLEQWRTFVAVVDYGGFAQAGDALFKTQSTISHSIKKLETSLEKTLFNVVGRKAVITPFGESLLSAARNLVTQADTLESEAISQKTVVQDKLNIAVDTLFPKEVLYKAMKSLTEKFPQINVQLYETALSRCAELLEDGTVDVGIASMVPRGYTGTLVSSIDMCASVHRHHALAGRTKLTLKMLEPYKQVVIRDGGLRANINSGWLGSSTRLTVTNLNEAIGFVNNNLGFAWLPQWVVKSSSNRDIVPLKLENGLIRTVPLQFTIRPSMSKNKIVQELGQDIKEELEQFKTD